MVETHHWKGVFKLLKHFLVYNPNSTFGTHACTCLPVHCTVYTCSQYLSPGCIPASTASLLTSDTTQLLNIPLTLISQALEGEFSTAVPSLDDSLEWTTSARISWCEVEWPSRLCTEELCMQGRGVCGSVWQRLQHYQSVSIHVLLKEK